MRSKLMITVLFLVGSIAMSAIANENPNKFKFPGGIAVKISRAPGFTRPRPGGLEGKGMTIIGGAPIHTTKNGRATTTSSNDNNKPSFTTTTKGKERDSTTTPRNATFTTTPKNDTFTTFTKGKGQDTTTTPKNGTFTTTPKNGTTTTWHLKKSKESVDKWVKVLLQANRTQIANNYKPIASIAPDFVEFHPDEML
ncbi:unnamed protein product, partial [Mesorhabditis belari]|uniref:Secreted protein n=1 Tax=Mesorhabditis belari TaxID=2138241 RepID=A0AAF3ESR1_9BILA